MTILTKQLLVLAVLSIGLFLIAIPLSDWLYFIIGDSPRRAELLRTVILSFGGLFAVFGFYVSLARQKTYERDVVQNLIFDRFRVVDEKISAALNTKRKDYGSGPDERFYSLEEDIEALIFDNLNKGGRAAKFLKFSRMFLEDAALTRAYPAFEAHYAYLLTRLCFLHIVDCITRYARMRSDQKEILPEKVSVKVCDNEYDLVIDYSQIEKRPYIVRGDLLEAIADFTKYIDNPDRRSEFLDDFDIEFEHVEFEWLGNHCHFEPDAANSWLEEN